MEVQDGFIVGVFNYCDRWCEKCPFTSRCGVFADIAEHDFEADHGPLTEPMAERQAKELAEHARRWERELGIDFAKIEEEASNDPDLELPEIRLEHLELNERAGDFGHAVWKWLDGRTSGDQAVRDAIEVIAHFAFLIPSKVNRALHGLADDDGDREFPPDFEGSAKVALLGIEQSTAAWRELASAGYLQPAEAAPFLSELEWLGRELERAIPGARTFVRPGFDEPDEVRMLDAAER